MKTLLCLTLLAIVFCCTTSGYAKDCDDITWLSSSSYFEDLKVTETVSHRELTTSEIAELLYRLPTVKTVILQSPPRPFSVESLAYPQNADRYVLTKKQWEALQRYCKLRLQEGAAHHPDVLAHWKSIVDGTPPFGLKISDK